MLYLCHLSQRPYAHNSKDFGFDYSDGDDAEDSGDVDLENMYYTAKCK